MNPIEPRIRVDAGGPLCGDAGQSRRDGRAIREGDANALARRGSSQVPASAGQA